MECINTISQVKIKLQLGLHDTGNKTDIAISAIWKTIRILFQINWIALFGNIFLNIFQKDWADFIRQLQQALLCLVMWSTMTVIGADKEKDCGYNINKPVKQERGIKYAQSIARETREQKKKSSNLILI